MSDIGLLAVSILNQIKREKNHFQERRTIALRAILRHINVFLGSGYSSFSFSTHQSF